MGREGGGRVAGRRCGGGTWGAGGEVCSGPYFLYHVIMHHFCMSKRGEDN